MMYGNQTDVIVIFEIQWFTFFFTWKKNNFYLLLGIMFMYFFISIPVKLYHSKSVFLTSKIGAPGTAFNNQYLPTSSQSIPIINMSSADRSISSGFPIPQWMKSKINDRLVLLYDR